MEEPVYRDEGGRPYTVRDGRAAWLPEEVYRDEHGRAYVVRDGVSVWLGEPLPSPAMAAARSPYVDFWPRAAARVLDTGVTYVLAFGGSMVFGLIAGFYVAATGGDTDLLVERLQNNNALVWVLSFAGSTAFWALAEWLHGSTPGKRVLGMTVRSEDGGPVRFGQALGRNLGFLVDALFFGVPALISMRNSPRRQRLGDRWAKTMVVKVDSLAPEQRRSGGRFALATAAACMAYIATIALVMAARVAGS